MKKAINIFTILLILFGSFCSVMGDLREATYYYVLAILLRSA